jgi:hypothetical protein
MRPFKGQTLQDVENVNKVVMFAAKNTRDLLNLGKTDPTVSKGADKCAELTGIGCISTRRTCRSCTSNVRPSDPRGTKWYAVLHSESSSSEYTPAQSSKKTFGSAQTEKSMPGRSPRKCHHQFHHQFFFWLAILS